MTAPEPGQVRGHRPHAAGHPALHRDRIAQRHARGEALGRGPGRFDGVEIFENDLIACPLGPSDIRLLAADLGLEILLYQPFRDFETTRPDQLAASLRRAERKFAVMTALGARTLLVCASVAPSAADDDAQAADQLRQLAERASQHGLRVAFEALAWSRHISSYSRAWQVVSRADHPQLGLCLDSFHIMSLGHASGPIRASPARRSSSSSWPTRRCCTWTRCRGAGTTAASPARAALTCLASRPTCWHRAIRARGRWRSSTMPSGRPTPSARRGTACARCSPWRMPWPGRTQPGSARARRSRYGWPACPRPRACGATRSSS